MQSLNFWLGHASHCNSYMLSQKMVNNCEFIYNNKAFEHIEKELIDDISNWNMF